MEEVERKERVASGAVHILAYWKLSNGSASGQKHNAQRPGRSEYARHQAAHNTTPRWMIGRKLNARPGTTAAGRVAGVRTGLPGSRSGQPHAQWNFTFDLSCAIDCRLQQRHYCNQCQIQNVTELPAQRLGQTRNG